MLDIKSGATLITNTALVLAGGLGTRLRSVLPDRPKPMAPVAGRPFLERLLDHWCDQGIKRFILSVGYLADQIKQHFGDNYKGCTIEYVTEYTPAGTGGALLLAADTISETPMFLVLNGDSFFPIKLREIAALSEETDADWYLSLFRSHENGRYGGVRMETNGRIRTFHSAGASSELPANGGVYLVRTRALKPFINSEKSKISLENEILPSCIASGQKVYGKQFEQPFLDIGLPHELKRAESFFLHEGVIRCE